MNPIPVHAFNPGPFTGAGNVTWLIPGRRPVLIDAGTGEARHLEALESALGASRLADVLVTHAHGDHASGAPAIAGRMPDARFSKMPWPERDARYPVAWHSLTDGDRIDAGDTTVVAVHTPGHAPDHLCFWHEETRTLFSGDLAVQGTSVVIPASQGGDLDAYLASIARVLELDPIRLLPAHGPVINRPAALLRNYVAHRREREDQVLAALGAGATSPETIVARVYSGLSEPLVAMARESVLAHLLKLQREQRVRPHEDGTWELTI